MECGHTQGRVTSFSYQSLMPTGAGTPRYEEPDLWLGSASWRGGFCQAPPADWKPGDTIGYLNSDFPEFELPSYRGERYEALAPDTLDLQDRARLVLHCMTEATNPLADYEIYGIVFFLCNPPQMQMDWGGPTVQVKFMQGVPLMRVICGDEKNFDVERKWMNGRWETWCKPGRTWRGCWPSVSAMG